MVLRDLGKDDRSLIEKLINDTILRDLLKVLERVLHDKRAGLVAGERSPLALERCVDAGNTVSCAARGGIELAKRTMQRSGAPAPSK